MELKAMTIGWAGKLVLAWFFYAPALGSFGDAMNDMQSVKWNDWMVVNDGVMGGLSQSRPQITDRNTLVFAGNVSLENNGGFASIRHVADPFDIGRGNGILLRVKGDGKAYQLRVRTSDAFDGIAYKADFRTAAGEPQEFRLPWSAFTATYRGRHVMDAPALNPVNIRQVSFLIADKQAGPFELEIGTIESF